MSRFENGNVPWNRNQSACQHGVGNMSKCSICRAAKDAAYYQRAKSNPRRRAALRERDRLRYLKIAQDTVRYAAYRQRKREWWADKRTTYRPIDSHLSSFLYGVKS